MNSHSFQASLQARASIKGQSSLRILSRIQLAMSLCIFSLEILAVSIATRYGGPDPPCGMATGIWVGVLGMIASGLGIGAFHSPYGHKCMMISHFVMGILATVADGILILFTTICQITLPNYLIRDLRMKGETAYGGGQKLSIVSGFIWLEFFLWTAGVTHFISCIVSSAYMCRHWCQDKQPPVTMVNLPSGPRLPPGGNGNGYEQNVVIEQLPAVFPRPVVSEETTHEAIG